MVVASVILLSFLIHLFKASAIFAVIALYIVYSINFHFISCFLIVDEQANLSTI